MFTVVPPAPPIEELEYHTEPLPAPPEPSAPAAPPALPFNRPLKSQLSSADSRADRLIRQLRGEVESIRGTLDQFASESAEMLEVDVAAVIADPAAAALLPPSALVRALIAATERNETLATENAARRRKVSSLRHELRARKLDDAATRARLGTLEEVIAALHANLEDLRAGRDQARAVIAPASVPTLRAPELPSAYSAFAARDEA